MKYIKKFLNIEHINDLELPNPFLSSIAEQGQIIANHEDHKKIKIVNGQINIVNSILPLPLKDSKGYYIIDGITTLSKGDGLYATPEGRLTLESEGNTRIGTFDHCDYTNGLYPFYANEGFLYPTGKIPQTAQFIKTSGFTINADFTAKDVMDYVLNHEDYDASKFGMHNDCYNYYTVGTQKGDWHIPSAYEIRQSGQNQPLPTYLPAGASLLYCDGFRWQDSVQINTLKIILQGIDTQIGYDLNGNGKYVKGYVSADASGIQLYFRPHIYIKIFSVKNSYYKKSGSEYKLATTIVPLKHDQTYAEQNITLYSQKTYDLENGETPNDFIINNDRYPILDEEVILTIIPEFISVNISGNLNHLTKGISYADQGYSPIYSKSTYNSLTESPSQFEIQDKLPIANEKVYASCNPQTIRVYINGSSKNVIPSKKYSEQGYSTLYSQNTFKPANNETASTFLIEDRLPIANERLFTTCTVLKYNVYIDNVYTQVTGYKYSEQGYTHLYSQQTYNIDNNESASDFDIVNTYPYSSQHVYTTMTEITNSDCIIYYDGTQVIVDPTQTFAEQGYDEIYNDHGYENVSYDYPINGSYYNSYPYHGGGGGRN